MRGDRSCIEVVTLLLTFCKLPNQRSDDGMKGDVDGHKHGMSVAYG